VTTSEKFWSLVRKDQACWAWTGGTNGRGYGALHVAGRKVLAHRFSYELHFGRIPPGRVIMHRCDNPICVRPDHLKLGTQLDNIADREAKGRGAWKPQPTCPRGHAFDAVNTYLKSDGRRRCRECARICKADRRTRMDVAR
jgi:hypothetical protein